ncbi:hypothetical protein lerEdw1_011966 [Lerista edwardsae]|nr:hypothetical protein lerEdw1_011966 [Lerista edwardsae]
MHGETVQAKIEVQLKISNRKFNDDLKNKSSDEYINFELDFKSEMNRVYKDVPGYREVVITDLRPGSIEVDHEVIIEAKIMNNVSAIDQTVQNLAEVVQQQLVILNSTQQNCTDNPDNSTFCFTAPPNPILNTSAAFSPEALWVILPLLPSFHWIVTSSSFPDYCKQNINPKYAANYYPNITNGILSCISNCSDNSPHRINCNNGVCRISERGAQCNCNDLSMFWYTDNFCRTRIHKGEVGLGIGLSVVLLVSVVLAIFLFKAKRKKPELSWDDDTRIWCEDQEEMEWVLNKGLTIMNEAASSSDERLERNKAFQPSLETVNTSIELQFPKPTVKTYHTPQLAPYPENVYGDS